MATMDSPDLFAEKLCKTVVIGLPGIGKTTLTNYLADQYAETSGKKTGNGFYRSGNA